MNVIHKALTNKKVCKFGIYLAFLFFINISISYALTDSNQSNNVMNISIDVVETEVLSFSFVHYAEDESDDVDGYDSLVSDQTEFISNVYPIRDETPFFVREESDFIEIDKSKANCSLVKDLARKVGVSSMNTSKVIGIISGASSNKYASGMAGFACGGTSTQVVIVTEETGAGDNKEASGAHEVGHTYGLCDEYNLSDFRIRDDNKTSSSGLGCPNGDKNEDGLLDSECINTYGVSGLKGCPVENQDLIIDIYFKDQGVNYAVNMYGSRPNKTSDKRRWVNNQTYSHLLSELNGTGEVICTDKELIIVSGNINKSFNTTLDNFYIVKGGCYVNETIVSAPANVTVLKIEQKGIGGVVLNLLSRVIDYFITGDGGELTEINEMPFVFVMLYNENATTFNFINQSNNASLTQRNVTPNTPSINITYPQGGENLQSKFNITWNATDADGDNVYYAVLISDDGGGNYTTLDIDLNQTYYELNPDDFDGGTNYMIKVLATDGVNTGSNVSNTFTLVPQLNINSLSASPSPQGFGENVTITANITDINGTSDIDTVLVGITPPNEQQTNHTMNYASGDLWKYNFTDFTNGTYTYTVYANDSTGLTDSASGTFEMYVNLYINIKTLNNSYVDNKLVNITDPPAVTVRLGQPDIVEVDKSKTKYADISKEHVNGDNITVENNFAKLNAYPFIVKAGEEQSLELTKKAGLLASSVRLGIVSEDDLFTSVEYFDGEKWVWFNLTKKECLPLDS